jgi:serine phosphatase RsbU (regulator of sigma subunit)
LLLFFLTVEIVPAAKSDTLYISSNSLKQGRFYLADAEGEILWRFNQGDSIAWASPEYDDSHWDTISPWMNMQSGNAHKWKGIGWFRKNIRIDPSLRNNAVGIYIHHEGASEIYLNGKKVFAFGELSDNSSEERFCDPKYSPCVFSFDSSLVYTLAVRYSNHSHIGWEFFYNKFFSHLGFSISIFDFNANVGKEMLDKYENLAFGWGLNGFSLAFSVIFFLLYFFYSKRKENLYFASFVFGIWLFGSSIDMEMMNHTSLEMIAFYRFLRFIGISLVFTFFLLFVYQIVYEKVITIFWVFLGAFAIINLIAFFGSDGIFSYMKPLSIVIAIMTFESVRVIVLGIKNRVEHIWILSVGIILFMLLTLSGMILPELLSVSSINSLGGPMFALNITVLPISMAVYLAMSYAKAYNDLEEQIVKVKELSVRQIEQERENAELQFQARLERQEYERKTKELEEARALQLAMLPKDIPDIPEFDIAVYMKTATEVGGDYYDFHVGQDDLLTAVVGDATGHGMNAGTMVTAAKSLFHNLAERPELEQLFCNFNKSLFSLGIQPMLMSLMVLRIYKQKVEVINGGMPELLIFKSEENRIHEIQPSGPPLGAFSEYSYSKYITGISPGDVILAMTDGFTERFNEKNEMLELEDCKDIFIKYVKSDAGEIINQLVREGERWGGDRVQEDDITFLVVKVK